MRCPVCGKEFEFATSTSKPFCSERCRSIDLGRWLDESYGLPINPELEADELSGGGAPPTNGETHDE